MPYRVCALVLIASLSWSPAEGATNFLIVIADDATFSDLPLFGGKNVRTPNIDRLASQGILFTQAYVITSGGPNYATYFFALNIYYTTFRSLRLGYASAMAWVLFLLILALTSVVLLSSRYWVYYSSEKETAV